MLFWVIARRVWSAWKQSLLIVTPETVVHWHRTGFCMYWRLISRVRRQVGRKRTPKEVQELIFRMLVGIKLAAAYQRLSANEPEAARAA
jgi:putative transposase